jgi:hypothetical protein
MAERSAFGPDSWVIGLSKIEDFVYANIPSLELGLEIANAVG